MDSKDYNKWKLLARQQEDKKTQDSKFLKNVLKDTFYNRDKERAELNKNDERMVFSILAEWPCLQYGQYVSSKIETYINTITIAYMYTFTLKNKKNINSVDTDGIEIYTWI